MHIRNPLLARYAEQAAGHNPANNCAHRRQVYLSLMHTAGPRGHGHGIAAVRRHAVRICRALDRVDAAVARGQAQAAEQHQQAA